MTMFTRACFAAAALALSASAAATAQECPAEPIFVGATAANADVRASNTRISRGDWRVAEHFAREALESRTSSRNKAAAAVNLCAALANQGSDDAAAACDDAVARNEAGWEAYNNRGAAAWLAGDIAAATADFSRAAELADGESDDALTNNAALASCAG
jgi:tetratricopeptide (TPR) repeat protein